MKFLRLRLVNYIGIYNGIGLRDLTIDLSKCTHRIVVIKGDNGSGKSTIMRSLSVFPDANNQFIPNCPASKEVDLFYDGIVYQIQFIHGISNSGIREVTKAFIYKNGENLNPNGNVKSYRDIVYEELNLDPNFESLSQLSLDDRGLADKRPAERKKFVNSILLQMQAYNGIYKTISKKVSTCKGLIGNISAKLNSLGDKDLQRKSLEDVERQINEIQDLKDKAAIELARNNFELYSIDPDGNIRRQYDDLTSRKESADKKCISLFQSFSDICNSFGLDYSRLTRDIITDMINRLSAELSTIEGDARVARIQLENSMASRESKSQEISKKTSRLNGLTNGIDYDNILQMIKDTKKEMSILESYVKFDLGSITEYECSIALESIDRIMQLVKSIKDTGNSAIEIAYENIRAGKFLSREAMESDFKTFESAAIERINRLTTEYNRMCSDMEVISLLNDRPASCKDDTCPFISRSIKIYNKYNGSISIEAKKAEIDSETDRLRKATNQFYINKIVCDAQFYINQLIRELKANVEMFKKIISIEIDPLEFSYGLVIGEETNTAFINTIVENLNQSTLIAQYRVYQKTLDDLLSEEKKYADKMSIIDDLNSDIKELNDSLNLLIAEIVDRSANIRTLESKAEGFRAKLADLSILLTRFDEYQHFLGIKTEIEISLQEIEGNIDKITCIKTAIEEYATNIKQYCRDLEPLMRTRDSINHSLRMIEEYEAELQSLNKDYELLELIRKYSSPTTGIQLVFMELYMGKIISLANTLLQFLFNGRFNIMPFIINESEFRIPCQGDGYLNDDITSMSSGQICMISMILSFAILYNSSTTYNIIKLDEIDGPLDDMNRAMFIDVLLRIMDIMKTEQCIMISHNTELDINNTDIISLTPTDGNFSGGNIIWSAY